jgi:hypothetical protein
VGHAIRLFAIVLLATGVAALAWWGVSMLGPRALGAEFVRAVPDDDAAPQAAEFRDRSNGPNSELLRVELLQIVPYLESPPRDRLSVSTGSIEETHEWIPGSEIAVAGRIYRVETVRTWKGLLPMTGGAQMVSVTLLRPDALPIEDILLRTGQRLDIGGDVSLDLRECIGRDDALALIAAAALDVDPGKWGIADGGGVIWFESFIPGTGATLSDGSLIMLESFSPQTMSLVVRKRTAFGVDTLRVDGPSSAPPLFLEYSRAASPVIGLYVIEDGRVLMAVSPPQEIAAGETWPFTKGPYTLRLEQAFRSAAPVGAADSPFFEGVLVSGEDRIRVRQGEAVRVGDSLLRYLREPNNATAAIHLRMFVSGDKEFELELRPGEQFILEWMGETWSLAHADIEPGGIVTIRRQGRPGAIAVAGTVAVFIAMLLLRKPRPRAAH